MSGPRRPRDPRCKKAPRNEMLLYATGKPRPLTPEQVAAQRERAKRVVGVVAKGAES